MKRSRFFKHSLLVRLLGLLMVFLFLSAFTAPEKPEYGIYDPNHYLTDETIRLIRGLNKVNSQKAEKFDLLVADLNKGGNTWFTKEEMTDDLNTVVYHGRLDVHEHSLPVFIVVDDSAFSYARIAITTTSIDKKVIPAVLKELNTLNQDYKISKYYVSNEDNNIYMDVSIPCLNEQFDPTVVVNLMLEVIQPHLDAVHKDILKVAGLA